MDASLSWSAETVWLNEIGQPGSLEKPLLVLLFNLECAGCVSRAVPFVKELHREFGEGLEILTVHTPLGHRRFEREQLVPQIERFARDFARLPVPVALDYDGSFAHAWGAQGTPHWLVFGKSGELVRSIFGSQENAQTRLRYLLEELVGEARDGSQ